MFQVDDWLGARYDLTKYNCGHFVAEIWKELTGEDISGVCSSFIEGDIRAIHTLKVARQIKTPESPCVVLMQCPGAVPHAGVFIRGKILHLTDNGAALQDFFILDKFFRLSFYK